MKSGCALFALAAFALMASCRDDVADPSPAAPGRDPVAEAPADGLTTAIAGNWRTEAEKARDPWRHPAETLTFFGVKPSDTVVEIAPGGG